MNPAHSGSPYRQNRHVRIAEQVSVGVGVAPLIAPSGASMFEPRLETEPSDPIESTLRRNNSIHFRQQEAPEKKLTLFALRLALFEKSASGLGTLCFVWATVVLLGGFAIKLEKIDFWFVTIILIVEGARIFGRSRELELQHESTWSLSEAGRYSFQALVSTSSRIVRALRSFQRRESTLSKNNDLESTPTIIQLREQNSKRTWESSEVPLLPYAGWVFVSKNTSKFLYWFQILVAATSFTLALMRLANQDYGESDPETLNREAALNIFYGLALAEALIFLVEKAYWEWTVTLCKLIEKVTEECGFEKHHVAWLRRFFYDAFSVSVNGSIFDGLKMDLLSFAIGLLQSNSIHEQLTGANMLAKFTDSDHFAGDAFRRIGTSTHVMERLVEMLTWRSQREEGIRKAAAEIVSKITGKKQNSLRVAGIAGAMESISSLLYTGTFTLSGHGIREKALVIDRSDYEYSAFNLLGLLILKKLANDHDNCGKIGTTRGLLAKIIYFTDVNERLLRDSHAAESQIMTVKRSLKLLSKLVSATGETGEYLRLELSSIVFTISNLRDILQYGEGHLELQSLSIDILTSLALNVDAKQKIGNTGGMIKLLFNILFKEEVVENDPLTRKLRIDAGEALATLALESPENCNRMMKLDVFGRLVNGLSDKAVSRNCARILRNVCAYGEQECHDKLKGIVDAAPIVLKYIMTVEDKVQQVAAGLAIQILRFMEASDFDRALAQADIQKSELARKLVETLRSYQSPSIKFPMIRRYVIEVALWMMKTEPETRVVFKRFGLEIDLKKVEETTSEVENYNVFSGSVGLSRHRKTLQSLIEEAMEFMRNC